MPPAPGVAPSVGDLVHDPALFDAMLADHDAAPARFQPTNYWKRYTGHTIRVIRDNGLRAFRGERQGYFRSMGASDVASLPDQADLVLERWPGIDPADREAVLRGLLWSRLHPEAQVLPMNMSRRDLDLLAARSCDFFAKLQGALPFTTAQPSLIGDWWHTFEWKKQVHTHVWCNYWWRYAVLAPLVNFHQIDTFVEIGSGAGNQAEVMRKLFPHLRIWQVDMLPNLYICERNLRATFGDAVLPYQATATGPLPRLQPGQIACVGNWRIGELEPEGRTLFFSASTFGEMEPDIVGEYLGHVARWADFIYLMQAMNGKEQGSVGTSGVLQPILFADYERMIGPGFSLSLRQTAEEPLRAISESGGYEDSLWSRR